MDWSETRIRQIHNFKNLRVYPRKVERKRKLNLKQEEGNNNKNQSGNQ